MTVPARRTVGDVVNDHAATIIAGICLLHAVLTVALLLVPRATASANVILAAMAVATTVGVLAIVWVVAVCAGLHRAGCCSSCGGDGVGGAASVPSHGGSCWDCQGTGHPHAMRPWER